MSIITKMQRFTNKSIGIILDRHNIPPPAQKLTLDTEGEYVEFKELKGMLDTGLLIEMSAELQETFLDAQAQRSLIATLTGMGYEDFDQVLQVLKEQRSTVLKPREFEVWMEGWQDNGHHEKARLLGKGVGYSFSEAVLNLKEQLGPKAKGWVHDVSTNRWSDYSCSFYDNETDARRFVG